MAGRNIKGITVEIGGDTTGLQNALKQVNSEIKNTQSQLKDVEKLLKLDPGNTELLNQRQSLLQESITATKEKLETLKTAAEQANQALANGDISQGQYDALQREIVETEQELKRLEEQAEQSATALQKIAAAGDKLQKAGDAVSGVGEKLMPVTAAVVGLGTAAVKTASDFDSAMSKVASVSGATGDDLDSLRDKAREMGAKTKFSAAEAAEAMNYMAMAGWKTSDMLNGIEGIMNLAAASGEDLATTSDIVTDALTAFGLSAADSGHFADILAATSSNANTNVSMMGETFKYAAPVAGALGYSVEDVAEAIGLMANSGIKASQAGTSLRTMLTSLQGEIALTGQSLGEVTIQTTNADGSMRSLGDILGDLRGAFSQMSESEAAASAETLVGKNAMSGFLAVMTAAPADIEKLNGTIATCSGTAENMSAVMQDNLAGQLTVLKSQLEELAISFGEILIPIVRDIVTHIQNFVDKLNGMDEGTRKVILTIAMFTAALGPVLIVIGKTMSAVGTIMKIVPKIAPALTAVKTALSSVFAFMAANPVTIVIAAVVALIAIFSKLWRNCEGFRNFWINLWKSIKTACVTAWNAIKKALSTGWNAIKNAAVTVWTAIANFFTTIWKKITTVVSNALNAIKNLISAGLTVIKNTFSSVWEQIKQVVSAAWNVISSTIRSAMTAISSFLTSMWNTITSGVRSAWSAIHSAISSALSSIYSAAASTFSNMWAAIASTIGNIRATIVSGFQAAIAYITSLPGQAFAWGRDIISNIVSGIHSMIGSVVSAVSNVASTIRSYLHFSVPDVGPLTDFESWMPDFMQGLAKGIEDSRGLVEKAVAGVASDLIINPKAGAFEESSRSPKTGTTEVRHSGTIRVEGVDNQNALNGVVDIIIDQLRREVRV